MGACLTRLAMETSHATTSFSPLFSRRSGSLVERMEGGKCVHSVEEKIEKSKSHWSQVVEIDSNEEVAEVSNVEAFKALQMHPTWGGFFLTFGEGGVGELVMGKKFAEGGQAELYEAQIEWNDPKMCEFVLKRHKKYVLKVFKKGTFLRHLQLQWPQGMLQNHVEKAKYMQLRLPQPLSFQCDIACGTLLKDSRFAFVLGREEGDLRNLIDRHMATPKDDGPFSKYVAELMMYVIARGMGSLHNCNIVHRDLKASNVLFSAGESTWYIIVADFECSIGVVGTGFFRAPEILQACKDKSVGQREELFTKEADVYSFGMTCYEILTGKLPFEGHSLNDYDLVLQGQRPELPKHVDDWTRELLIRCWQSNPTTRPSCGEILKIFLANSVTCREFEVEFRCREVDLGIKLSE